MTKKYTFNGGTLTSPEIYGVQRNTLEILFELDNLVKRDEVEVVIPENSARTLKYRNIKVIKLKNAMPNVISKFYWNHILFPNYVKKNKRIGIDMVLALPMFNCPIVAIYDCIAEKFPENAKTVKEKLSRAFYVFRVKNSIRKRRMIITDSESAKNDIMEIYHCNSNKIKVIPCSWQHFERINEDDTIIKKLDLLDKEFFFSLGSRYIHKNLKWIVEAARQNPQYTFVSSGTSKLNTSDSSIDNNGLSNLIFAGYLSDEQVKSLMKNCKAFIQPSLYEGFGIPPMEAMSVGASCIVANNSSLPEIYGDYVRYIDSSNYLNIDMDRIMETMPIKDEKQLLEKYSWKKSAGMLKNELDGFSCARN